jgi:hypothetical protein
MARGILIFAVVLFTVGVFSFAQNEELIFPIVVNGMIGSQTRWQTTFRAMNLSSTTITFLLEPHQFDGKLVSVAGNFFCDLSPVPSPVTNVATIGIIGNGSFELSTSDATSLFFNGWARLVYPAAVADSVVVSSQVSLVQGLSQGCPILICSRPSTEFVTIGQIRPVKAAKSFRAPGFATPVRQTAYSIVNPSENSPAMVSATLFDGAGKLVRTSTLAVPPLNKVSKFFRELFPNCSETVINCGDAPVPQFFHGSVKFVSSAPIAIGALTVVFPEGKIAELLLGSQ